MALIGAVILISSLLSGFVERTGLPQVAVFLALGVVIGPYGLGLVDVTLHSPILRVVAALSLALVLFMDAVSLNLRDVKKHRLLSFLVLGPGTLLSALLIAVTGNRVLEISLVMAAILGAALASTDPVLLRGIIRNPQLSGPVRQALRIESGLNDLVLLPIVLVGIAAIQAGGEHGPSHWARLALNLAILSPAAGIVVALCAIGALEVVRRRTGVRRDYESIYSLGVAFAAFAAAESVHGSGFIAAFAAGLTVSALDVELCDCFIEYGETTAEMALLFSFVLFGMSLIWQGLAVITPLTLLFAVGVICIRPLVLIPSLAIARLPRRDLLLLGWFGPRGLSSLLLILLPVFAQVPAAETLFSICCLVVLLSVILHGFSPMFLFPRRTDDVPKEAVPQLPKLTVVDPKILRLAESRDGEYIQPEQVLELIKSGSPKVVVADARSVRSFEESDRLLRGGVRINPEHAVQDARSAQLPTDGVIAVLCA